MEESKGSIEIDEDLIEEAKKRSARRRELLRQGHADELLKEETSVGSHLSSHIDNEANIKVNKKRVRNLKMDRSE